MRPWPWAVLELDRVCAASNLLCCSCDLKVWYGSALRVALAKLISYLYIDVCRSEDEGKNKKNLARDLKKIKVIFLPPVKLCYLILMLLFVIDVNMRKIRDHNEAK